jgi:SAM-dependent methyltransferase
MTDNAPKRTYASDYVHGSIPTGRAYDKELAQQPFDAFLTRQTTYLLPKILRDLFPNGVPRSLDFACGTGRITSIVEPHSREPWALDVSELMMSAAREKCPGTRFVLAGVDDERLPVTDLDVVTAFRYFGNASDPERQKALGKITRGLREGGYLVTNNHRNPDCIERRLRRMRGKPVEAGLTHRHFCSLLRDHDLRVVGTYPMGVWLLRGKWFHSTRLLESASARWLDRFTRVGFLTPIAPNYLLVAQK